MTNTPVKDVGFGLNGPVSVSAVQNRMSGDFQAVWNHQRSEGNTYSKTRQDLQPVKKTSYDSMKARDEHRARTEKREPGRNVEERTDTPEETAEVLASSAIQNQSVDTPVAEEISPELLQTLEETAAEAVAQAAEAFGMTETEVREAMAALGMEDMDVLNPGEFGKLLITMAGEKDVAALVTDEELYGRYRELMQQLEGMLKTAAEKLDVPAEQLTELGARVQAEEAPGNKAEAERGQNPLHSDEPVITVEGKTVGTEMNSVAETSGFPEAAEEGMDSRDGKQAAEKEHSHREEGEGTTLFVQNLRTQQSAGGLQQSATVQSGFGTDTQNIMRQIMDYMRISLKSDMSSMEMQLHPASLGTLHVQVASKDGVVTASFITQNEAVKAALEGQMLQLKEQFAEQGVRVEAIEVSVQTRQYEQNQEQDRNSEDRSREPSRRGRLRRINLMEESVGEASAEEEMLTRDIMAQNGNTVDYTA